MATAPLTPGTRGDLTRAEDAKIAIDAAGDAVLADDAARASKRVRSDRLLLEEFAGLREVIREIDRELNRTESRRIEAIGRAADFAAEHPDFFTHLVSGPVSSINVATMLRRAVVSEIALSLSAGERVADDLVTDAEILRELPSTRAAFAAGDLSLRHVRVIEDALEGTSPHTAAHVDACVAQIRDDAVAHGEPLPNSGAFSRRIRRAREQMEPRSVCERHEHAAEKRHVWTSTGPDGMAWFGALLPAITAHAAFDRLTTAATHVRGPLESRTLDQLRADALCSLLLDDHFDLHLDESADGSGGGTLHRAGGSAADGAVDGAVAGDLHGAQVNGSSGVHGGMATVENHPTTAWSGSPVRSWVRGIRPTVVITVPALTLLGQSDEPGQLEGYGPIAPDVARELAAQATSFIRVLTHPESGAVLSVGRERYVVPKDLRTWLAIRDGTCRFPGCGARTRSCDVDHTIDWQDGGSTSAWNLAHLCRRHHRLKHESSWSVRSQPNGEMTWTSPSGTVHTTDPAVRLPAGMPQICVSLDESGRGRSGVMSPGRWRAPTSGSVPVFEPDRGAPPF